MMKKTGILFIALAWVFTTAAQDIPIKILPSEIFKGKKRTEFDDTAHWRWRRGGIFNLNVAQGSLRNWAAGGDQFSLAISSYTNYYVLYRKGRKTWDNNLDVNFGYIQTTSLGARKNDDRFDLLSKAGYSVDTMNKWYVSGLFNLRSQFFDGQTYSGNVGTLASTFLSPAYIVLSLGMDYKPNSYFSVFVSPLTSRWVVVANDKLVAKGSYGVPAGKHSTNEFGAFASLNFNHPIGKNVTYKGRLDLFSNYKDKPANVDLFMTNYFSFKINRFLSATYSLDLIYDDDVKLFGDNNNSPALQLKSIIGIGFALRFAEAVYQ